MIIAKKTVTDWGLVAVVLLLSIGANLPGAMAARFDIDQKYLLIGLIAMVAVSLVRYLKFTLILVVAVLAVGANLPTEMAHHLGVEPNIMLLALVAMVMVSLLNRLMKLPTGLGESARTVGTHGALALYTAILKGRMSMAESLLRSGVNVNVKTREGVTPLMAAASKGYSDMVRLLLDSGADVQIKDNYGNTALGIATRMGYTRTAEMLRTAGARE